MSCIQPARINPSLLPFWILATLIIFICTTDLLAQVSFYVSPDSKQLSVEFSKKELINDLDEGKVATADILKIYAGVKQKAEIAGQSAVLGNYSSNPGQIIFKPLVPFSEELPYLAVFGDSLVYQFSIDVPNDRAKTRILQVYPTTDTVPANLLKIYLEFSAPMREGEVYDRVSIYDVQGNPIKDPFVPLHPELWDSSGHRVTLWLDPGRVKRALLSRKAHGPVLEPGKSYRLVVDNQWKDVHGQPMEHGITKVLHVLPDDRVKPETKSWVLTTPIAGSRGPLIVTFGEPMDYATSLHAFSVMTLDGKKVPGSVVVGDKERILKYNPKSIWNTGDYILVINSILEDMAGNNLNRLFDRDLSNEEGSSSEQEFYEIEFEVYK